MYGIIYSVQTKVMKSVKYIDDVGRIVIPKDIRTYFKIKTGDPLCIEVFHETIRITKEDTLLSYEDFIRKLISIMEQRFDFQYMITDRNHCLFHSDGLFLDPSSFIEQDETYLKQFFLDKGYPGVVSFIRIQSVILGILYIDSGPHSYAIHQVFSLLLENELAIS